MPSTTLPCNAGAAACCAAEAEASRSTSSNASQMLVGVILAVISWPSEQVSRCCEPSPHMLSSDDRVPVAIYKYGTVNKAHHHIKRRAIEDIPPPVAEGAHQRQNHQHQPIESNSEKGNPRIEGDPQRNQEVQHGKQQALPHQQLVFPIDSGQPG